MPSERLQKIIAAAGIASRRSAEKLITSGAVSVNGTMVTELGSKADPEHDHIRVNGKLLHGAERQVYVLMNKPKGYVTTVSDPEGRPTVMDLLRGIRARVYPIGRLDYASEGLLLLTNDGELAHLLMKAASHVPKVYLVKVAGVPDETGLQRLRRGLMIPEARNFRSARSRFAPTKNAGDAESKSRPGSKGKVQDSGDDSESEFTSPAASDRDKDSRNTRNKRAAGPRVKTAPAQIRLV